MQKEVRGGDSPDNNNDSAHLSLSPANQSDTTDLVSFYCLECLAHLQETLKEVNVLRQQNDQRFKEIDALRREIDEIFKEVDKAVQEVDALRREIDEALKEAVALRQENYNLRVTNADLVKRLGLLSQSTMQNCVLSPGHPPASFINDFNRLNVGGTIGDHRITEEVSNISPTSAIEHTRYDWRSTERVTLPKSISVRPSGYLNMTQRGGSDGGPSRGNRGKSPIVSGSQGAKREEEAFEFKVYNQGMSKTELCNKWQRMFKTKLCSNWQQSGECQYGQNCWFAHGITELRPVSRHPHYKTEVCWMVLAGDNCPYGDQCHFRHSLTDQESSWGHLNRMT